MLFYNKCRFHKSVLKNLELLEKSLLILGFEINMTVLTNGNLRIIIIILRFYFK